MKTDHKPPTRRYLLIVEIVLLLWGAALLVMGIRHLRHNPIVPWPSPTAPVILAAGPSPTLSPTASSTPATATRSPSATIPRTWTPSPRPPATSSPTALPEPSATATAESTVTPTPSATEIWIATPTPGPSLTARPLQSPTLAPARMTPEATPVTAVPTMVPTAWTPDNAINVLLLGSDTSLDRTSWRTDVIIVVSINPDGPSAAMLSIPRDLYVWVPEWKMAKINTVDAHGQVVQYEGGGPGLLKQTLLYNLGIPVHYYARVDFQGFQRIVDTLGGLNLPVTCEMTDWRLKSPELEPADEENWELFTVEQKMHQMNGEFALWYARSRKRSSDFDRSRRQQQVLRAMMAKALDINMIPQIPQLWADFAGTVETDLGLGEILQLAAVAPQLGFSKIKSRFISGDAVMAWTSPNDNAYVLLPQPEEIAELVADVFEPPALNRAFQDPAVVEVWNGTIRADLDLLAADNLVWEGLAPVLGQADRNDYAQTQVIYFGQTFKGAYSWSITKLFGLYESQMIHQPDPDSPVDYRVILGADFDPCVHRVQGARSVPTATPTPIWTPPPED